MLYYINHMLFLEISHPVLFSLQMSTNVPTVVITVILMLRVPTHKERSLALAILDSRELAQPVLVIMFVCHFIVI